MGTNTKKLGRADSVRRRPAPLSSRICDEVVLFDSDNGAYFGMNLIGSRIWDLIEQPKTVDQVIQHLLLTFEVPEVRCEEDVTGFLNQLVKKDLVEVVGDCNK